MNIDVRLEAYQLLLHIARLILGNEYLYVAAVRIWLCVEIAWSDVEGYTYKHPCEIRQGENFGIKIWYRETQRKICLGRDY
jgi:hypothetical protein